MERDILIDGAEKLSEISTHTLTWSVTGRGLRLHPDKDISTHTLTWSVTKRFATGEDNNGDFNSHAHVERDHGVPSSFNTSSISTHTLTWSVTVQVEGEVEDSSISTHTLTWSVTRCKDQICRGEQNFNSHAHVERDPDVC
mgnify:CR=1 FL=1